MALYSIKSGNLIHIEEIDFPRERDIQKICEENLNQLFGLEVVKSELSFNNFRIDTLAFNPKLSSFVVIEYKKDKNFSIIDQGYAYLSLLLNNKADFIIEYNENRKTSLKRNDVDWTQTRVIFISPSFTPYQIQSINFKDLPIELWEIRKFANDTISLTQVQSVGVSETIKTISKTSKTMEGVSKVIKVYSENKHLEGIPSEIVDLYDKIKIVILNISKDIKIKPTKKYIGFISKTNFIDIRLQKKALKIWFNLKRGELDDPQNLTRDVSNTGHWGNGDYELHIYDDENIDYVINLAKQSYKKNSI